MDWDFLDKFKEQDLDSELRELTRDKSYHETHQQYADMAKYASYLFIVVSILTASYAVYWVLLNMLIGTGLPKELAYAASIGISLLFLLFVEKMKRSTSNEFWKSFLFKRNFSWGWFAALGLFLAASLSASTFGGSKSSEDAVGSVISTEQYSKTREDYIERRKELANQQALHLTNRNDEGQVQYRSERSAEKITTAITDIDKKILEIDEKLSNKEDMAILDKKMATREAGNIAWWFTLLSELFFECCMAYIWLFKSNVAKERKLLKPGKIRSNKSGHTSYKPPSPKTPKSVTNKKPISNTKISNSLLGNNSSRLPTIANRNSVTNGNPVNTGATSRNRADPPIDFSNKNYYFSRPKMALKNVEFGEQSIEKFEQFLEREKERSKKDGNKHEYDYWSDKKRSLQRIKSKLSRGELKPPTGYARVEKMMVELKYAI